MLEVAELKKAVGNAELKMTDEELENLITELDNDANGRINYSEFLAATVNV